MILQVILQRMYRILTRKYQCYYRKELLTKLDGVLVHLGLLIMKNMMLLVIQPKLENIVI